MAVKELSEKIDLESNDLKSLFTNYSDLLKKELPKKEKVDIKKGA